MTLNGKMALILRYWEQENHWQNYRSWWIAYIDRVSRKYSLLINVDKTKAMASYGIACHILIQNEQLEQVDTFPYIGFLITEDGECTMEYRTRLNRGAGDRGITAKNMEKSQNTDFNEDTTNESASVACSNVGLYGCESWTIKRIKK